MTGPEQVHGLEAELDRLLAERQKAEADLRNSGDQKYATRLKALNEEITTLETALGDARV
jgi:lipid II:glycine glycyltransferase (peptidoglycan interpeptide bridge formation enzyme)